MASDGTDVRQRVVEDAAADAWLDLTCGPVMLSVPDTAGRYYVVQAIDEWSLTLATVGTRTTGNAARSFVFVSPETEKAGESRREHWWPSDATVIRSPTSYVWLLLRIQSDDPEELDVIRRLQGRFPLRVLDGGYTPATPAGASPCRRGTRSSSRESRRWG
jgi:hypothetical protein